MEEPRGSQATERSSGSEGVASRIDDPIEDAYVESVGGHLGHALHVDGVGLIVRPKHYPFVCPEKLLEHARIEDLHGAMLDPTRCCAALPGSPEYVYLAADDPDDFHVDSAHLDESVRIEATAEDLVALVEVTMRRRPSWTQDEFQALFLAATNRAGCYVKRISVLPAGVIDEDDWPPSGLPSEMLEELDAGVRGDPHVVRVRVGAAGATTVGQLVSAGRNVEALLNAYQTGALTVDSVRDLVRARRPELLIGVEEGSWFEAKSSAYNVSNGSWVERQKIELAQDVARFANGDVDAVLILGLKESKSEKSHISEVSPVDLSVVDVEQYRSILDARIVPAVQGLLVEAVELDHGKGLVMISVPPQPAELQPYLVHGAIVGDKVEGEFFSIVQRRGEASITTTASQIHGYIVAGRAFLRSSQKIE